VENNFSRRLLPRDEVKLEPGALELGVRIPWYRSLPLSVVEVGELNIDGEAVPASDMRFALNGKEFALGELERLTSEFWYLLDSARLRVRRELDPKRKHSISLTLNLYPPYIPGLTWVTRGSTDIEARQ
jgi:hypothetical protein